MAAMSKLPWSTAGHDEGDGVRILPLEQCRYGLVVTLVSNFVSLLDEAFTAEDYIMTENNMSVYLETMDTGPQ